MKNYLLYLNKRNLFSFIFWTVTCFVLFIFPKMNFAQENAKFITYGNQASTYEGDHDFLQIVFIKIPVSFSKNLHIRIFDADCGGKWDAMYGTGFETETLFRLLGGTGAFSDSGNRTLNPDIKSLKKGTLLTEASFGEDPFKDNKWYNFAEVNPKNGELSDNHYYFKLIVQGVKGDDGNVFEIEISEDSRRNIRPEEIEIFTYIPTIRLPNKDVFCEIPFFAGSADSVFSVNGFDITGGNVSVETVYRSNIPAISSGQSEWMQSEITIFPDETNRFCALRFEGGSEMPNDATIYIRSKSTGIIPVSLPIYLREDNNRPQPSIQIEYLADCNTVLLDGSRTRDEEGDAIQYLWDFGDGFTGSGSRVTHKYNLPGTYLGKLIVSDASGHISNSAWQTVEIKINNPPKANAGPDLVGSPGYALNFDGSASQDSDGEIIAFTWNFGDGKRAKGKVVPHIYKQSGFYKVSLRIEDNSESPCNYSTDEMEVWINAQPVVEIGADLIASPNEAISLSGLNCEDSDGNIISHFWDLGDKTNKNGSVINHSYANPGTYEVTLEVTDNAGVRNSSANDRLKVFVNDPPIADAGRSHRVAINEKISFDGSGSEDRDGKIIKYSWNFGDGSSDRGKITKHAYKMSGEYWAVLKIQDNSKSTSDIDIDSTLVIINYPPIAAAGPDQSLTSSIIRFDAKASSDIDGEIIHYNWDYGDGTVGSGAEPAHVYANPGTYTVRLKVTDDSKTSTQSTLDYLTVHVNSMPIADAGPDLIGTPGQKVRFNGLNSFDPDGQLTDYLWDFGDGEYGNGVKTTHVYDRSGHYTVLLTIKDDSRHAHSVGYDECQVWINKSPVAVAGMDIIAAPEQMLEFSAKSSYDVDGKIVKFKWNFSDEKMAGEKPVMKRSFSNPGMYTAVLTVVDNSGASNNTSQDRVKIRINSSPEPDAGENIHTCSRSITFDGSGSKDADGDQLTYIWDFGDNSPRKNGVKVVHNYKKGGTYPVLLYADDGRGLANSSSAISITVKINESPRAVIGEDLTVCAGDVVVFNGINSSDPEGGLLKYSWEFGDGEIAEGLNPTKKYMKGGVYKVTLKVEDDSGLPECNTSTDQIVVWVTESPVANAGPDQIICANSLVTFDGSKSWDVDGLVNSFSWDFGDGSTGGGQNPTHVYAKHGTFRVILTITGDQVGNCDNSSSDEMTVTVYEAPVAIFNNPPQMGVKQPVKFDASGSKSGSAKILQWAWDFGDSTYGEGEKVEHIYSKYGKYIISLKVTTDSETTCSETSTKNIIEINEAPVASAGDDMVAGVNQVITFDASDSFDLNGAISTFAWDFGDGQSDAGVIVRHQYSKPGAYKVVLKVIDDTDLSNNTDFDTLSVLINDPPLPVIECKKQISINEEIVFNGSRSKDINGRILEYSWDFGDGKTGSGVKVNHKYSRPGQYVVILNVDDGSKVNNSHSQITEVVIVNVPPVSNAGEDILASANETVKFNGSKSIDFDGKINSFIWQFGDGETGKEINPTHVYKSPGIYSVLLKVIDDSNTDSNTGIDTISVRINARPVAEAGDDRVAFTGGAHDAVLFDASKSFDPDGDPLTFKWQFGDGKIAKGVKVNHTFTKSGIFNVTLEVDDGSNTKSNKGTDTVKVTVKEH